MTSTNKDSMEVESDTNIQPQFIPLPSGSNSAESNCPSFDSRDSQGSVENEIRRIISKKRSSSSNDTQSNKRVSIDPSEAPDPRLVNKYSLDSKPPFIVHIEQIIPPPPHAIYLVQDSAKDKPSNKAGNSQDSDRKQKSANSTYGIIAMGKRLTKYIEDFNTAFDLKTIGRNKFSVTFSEGTTANRFVESFNNKLNQIFPGERWVAAIPNFKVIKQYILRGIDDDDSPEELLANIRLPPEWGILWTPPFEVSRLKKPVRQKSNNNNNNMVTKYVDSESYIVRFRASIVPPSVIYMGKRLVLRPYIQRVRRCDRCHRYGHIAKICRTTDSNAICVRCGKYSSTHNGDDKSKCTSDKPSCINCIRHKLKDSEHGLSFMV